MKTAPACFLLAFIAGCGAFLHHVTDDRRRPLPPRIPVVDGPPARTPAGELKAIYALTPPGAPDVEFRAALDRHYAGKTGEYFARLGAELPEDRGYGPSDLVEYWAAADAAGLLDFAERNPKKMPLGAVLQSCALHDPAAVLALLRRREAAKEKGKEEGDPWKDLWTLANQSKPAQVLAIAWKEGMLKTHPERFASCMAAWAGRDEKAALAFAITQGVLLQSAIEGWSATEPESALAWMEVSGNAAALPELRQKLILTYARTHPKEAARYRDEAEDQAEFDRCVVEGMVEQYPSEALKLDISLEKGSGHFANLTFAMARRTPEEAAAYIKALPANRQLEAYDSICSFMSGTNPREAVKVCTGFPELLASEDHDPNDDPGAVFTRLAREDPRAAIEWMKPGKIPEALRERVLPPVVDIWMGTDREAATRYVQSLPASELKGRMLMDASHLLGEVDREAARDYAMTLTDAAERAGACRRILEGIGGYNEAAASREAREKAWIAEIPDAAVRKILLTPPPALPEPKVPDAASGDDPFAVPEADPFAK